MRRELTQGSVVGHILRLAWPTAVAMMLQTAFNIVDAIFVGRLGSGALAAVSHVFPVMFLVFALSSCVAVGGTSLIARRLGQGDQAAAESAAAHAFVMAAVLGCAIGGMGLLASEPLFRRLGAEPDVLPMVVRYGTWIFPGCLFVFLGGAASGVLRAEGDMKTPMGAMIVAPHQALRCADAFVETDHTEGLPDDLACFLKDSLRKIAGIESETMKGK